MKVDPTKNENSDKIQPIYPNAKLEISKTGVAIPVMLIQIVDVIKKISKKEK